MELYIDIGIAQSRSLLVDEGSPVSIYIIDHDMKNISGNIYKGRVENITESLGCAFVNIGEDKCGMLHFDDFLHPLKKGEEILVQVTREPSGNKGARLSMDISMPSKNIVLLSDSNEINISKKIQNSKRRRELFNLGKKLTLNDDNIGIIFRTQCEEIDDEDICKEYNYLKKLYTDIKNKWIYIKGNTLVFEAKDFINYIKREYVNSSLEKIYINNDYIGDNIREYIKDKGFNIEVSTASEAIDRCSVLKNTIEYAMSSKFTTNTGDIVVDEAEAFTIIDVNYNSYIKGESLEDNILKGNLGACDKISEIISLKGISGIILIDFVNMKSDESRNRVIKELEMLFDKYNLKVRIHGFTKLGILEMTRAKKTMPLKNIICKKSSTSNLRPLYHIKNLENDILNRYYKSSTSQFNVYVSEDIYSEAERIQFVETMKKSYGIKIVINKIKDFLSYSICDNINDDFARISIGKRNVVGRVSLISEDDKSFHLTIEK